MSEIEAGGQSYVRALAWLEQNDWALVVRVPSSRAFERLYQARLVLVGIVLLTMAVIAAVVVSSTRKLIGKLEEADSSKEELRLQLFNAAKLASVGEMAAGVAHEINNPLAIIYEEASMMEDTLDPQFSQKLDPDDFQERLAAIKEATIRGRGITSKLLAFARRHDPDPEPSDINLLIDWVLENRALELKVSNIEVVKDYAQGLPTIMVNRNQMDQVMLNLINNAKDAIENSGRIMVRTSQEGAWIKIEVEDTGCGMTPEIMEKIFYPFFTTTGVGKGTGLGLSISYDIVESLGGRIEVRSEPDKGSSFIIYLPKVIRRERTGERQCNLEGGHV